LLITISYGFFSGQLTIGSNAPWHSSRAPDGPVPD